MKGLQAADGAEHCNDKMQAGMTTTPRMVVLNVRVPPLFLNVYILVKEVIFLKGKDSLGSPFHPPLSDKSLSTSC